MNRRVETRVVRAAGVAMTVLISKDACEVYWITACPNVFLTAGRITIYDGFDAAGLDKWETHPGQSRHYNFVPPIPCEQGLTVDVDQAMGCFTIAWRPKKWDRARTHPGDVITAPEP